MKKIVIASLIMLGTTVFAQNIDLACNGQITSEGKPVLKNIDKKDWFRFNVTIEPEQKMLTIGPSYYTAYVRYSNLLMDHAGYSVNYLEYNPDPDYAYKQLNIYINRYTGEFKMTQEVRFKVGGSLKSVSNGTCQIGVHWQQKF